MNLPWACNSCFYFKEMSLEIYWCTFLFVSFLKHPVLHQSTPHFYTPGSWVVDLIRTTILLINWQRSGFPCNVLHTHTHTHFTYKMTLIFTPVDFSKHLNFPITLFSYWRRTEPSEKAWIKTPVVTKAKHLSKGILRLNRCFLKFSLFLLTLRMLIYQAWRFFFEIIISDVLKDDW